MQITIKKLDKSEILRYLGWKGTPLPDHMEKLIDDCIQTTIQTITPKYLFRRFPISREHEAIKVEGAGVVLTGKSIFRHLHGCDEVYLMCVTVGLEIEKLIRIKMVTSPDLGVIYDSCASSAVEALADEVQELIRAECKERGKFITSRFSPGYGDLPLDTQKELLLSMDSHRKIGLSLTDSLLLTPNKSVTAIIGITDENKDDKGKSKCDHCTNRDNCSFCNKK
jgi:hypothetical protein